MESNPKTDMVAVSDVMEAIEKAYFEAGDRGSDDIAYLIGYISSDLGVSGTDWLRSLHARLDRGNDEE